jgi:hypothetical protein
MRTEPCCTPCVLNIYNRALYLRDSNSVKECDSALDHVFLENYTAQDRDCVTYLIFVLTRIVIQNLAPKFFFILCTYNPP